MHLTMLISGSKYPKFIYNMPLFEFGIEKQFEFEFKFKFELKQKKKKEKEKKQWHNHLGWLRACRAHLLLFGPKAQSPLGREAPKEKRKWASPTGPGPRPSLFPLGPATGRSLN